MEDKEKKRIAELRRYISQIDRIIKFHERYRNSYHWKPNSLAKGRRMSEERFNRTKPEGEYIFELKDGNVNLNVSMNYSESCKRCYYDCAFEINKSKTTLTKIKSLERTIQFELIYKLAFKAYQTEEEVREMECLFKELSKGTKTFLKRQKGLELLISILEKVGVRVTSPS